MHNRIVLLVVGLLLLAIACGGGAMYLLTPVIVPGAEFVSLTTLALSVAFLAAFTGATFVWESWQAARDQPSPPLPMPRPWAWLILGVVSLAAGSLMQRGTWAAYLFPPFHILTISAWSGLLLSLVWLRLPRLTIRESAIEIGYGAFVATTLSAIVEIAVFVILGVLAVALTMALPGGAEWVQELQAWAESAAPLADIETLSRLLLQPAVIVAIAVALAIVVPLIEESFKALGVLLLMHQQPERRRAVAWGLLCGLGFGWLESLLTAASAGDGWVMVTTLRLLTIAIHAGTGALMGLGWHAAVRERRLWRLAGCFVLAVVIHGAWNGLAIMGGLISLLSGLGG